MIQLKTIPWKKSFKDVKKHLRREYSLINTEQHSKKYQIWKRLATMAYIDSGFKNLRLSTSDWLLKWTDA